MSDTIPRADPIKALTGMVRGVVVAASDPDYDDARAVYNAMHDGRPLAVVQCTDSADVMAEIAAARDSGVDLAVRGGGHSVPGFGTVDDGLAIDLSPMKGVRVDRTKKVARVGGGATLGDVDHATYPFGLAAPGGAVSTTGVAGLTLGGGIGYLTRSSGLSIDNLLSADVVLADDRQVTASDYQNEDLFWAPRGGGGNFVSSRASSSSSTRSATSSAARCSTSSTMPRAGYISFMPGDDHHRAAANYGANHDRLSAAKAVYDPENLIHVNQNIAPEEGSERDDWTYLDARNTRTAFATRRPRDRGVPGPADHR